jgi:hypothetical protein
MREELERAVPTIYSDRDDEWSVRAPTVAELRPPFTNWASRIGAEMTQVIGT